MPHKLTQDLTASFVVFLIALPLSMGIAIASGVPPALGLVTAIIGGVIVGAFGGAPLQISGPSAGLTVLIVQMHTDHGMEKLGAIVIIAGLTQLAAGLMRIGRQFQAVSPAVIRGMLSGIGVLIIASQFHVMIDDSIHDSGLQNLVKIPEGIWKAVTDYKDRTHDLAAIIGIATLVSMIAWDRAKPKQLKVIPGPLVGAGLAAGLAAIFALPIRYVAVPENLIDIMTFPSADTLTYMMQPDIIGAGVGLAFVASAETLLCATAVSRMHDRGKTNYDRELAVHGVANLCCGLLGVLPMTGVISRSTANVEAEAQTRRSAVLHATWITIFVVFLPNVLGLVPTSSLAAILVYIGFKLLNVRAIKALSRFGKPVIGIFLATAVSIVAIDLLKGIVIGLVLSAIRLMYTISHVEYSLEKISDDRVDLHMFGSATFLGLPKLADVLDGVPPKTELHIHFDELEFIDHACLDLISEFRKRHESNDGQVVVEWEELFSLQTKSLGDEVAASQGITLNGDSAPPPPEGDED